MRILLVEDDTLIGDGIKAGLSKMGFSVDWFTEGRPGKEALYSAPYDAVILDLTLPGMDGRDILREWREKGKQEPVLILTARDALAERVEGLRLGADDYLCKPFALIEVAARLEALVRRASGQANGELRHGGDAQSGQSRRDACRRTAGPKTKRVRVAGTLTAQQRSRAAAQAY